MYTFKTELNFVPSVRNIYACHRAHTTDASARPMAASEIPALSHRWTTVYKINLFQDLSAPQSAVEHRRVSAHKVNTGSAEHTGLSTDVFCRTVTFADPMSPDVLNLTPSLVTLTMTVSPMLDKSFMMRWNSPAGIRTLRTGRGPGFRVCKVSARPLLGIGGVHVKKTHHFFGWPIMHAEVKLKAPYTFIHVGNRIVP